MLIVPEECFQLQVAAQTAEWHHTHMAVTAPECNPMGPKIGTVWSLDQIIHSLSLIQGVMRVPIAP
jgi:3-deoxy-D-arabino-heptulosonate 7-phosphate (DAHP) synthase class II